jgi:hypothetical protein
MPSEESLEMRRLSGVLHNVNKFLQKKHNKEVWSDRVEGVRATIDDADLLRTKHRKRRHQVSAQVAQLQTTDDLIDIKNLPKDLHEELRRSRKAISALQGATVALPQLPAAEAEEEE